MLNWEQIAQRIHNPAFCSADDLSELKDLCEKYPYSQVFPMVYLKVLSDGKHIHFEEELENFAYRITDRVQLYDLLHNHRETVLDLEAINESEVAIEPIENEVDLQFFEIVEQKLEETLNDQSASEEEEEEITVHVPENVPANSAQEEIEEEEIEEEKISQLVDELLEETQFDVELDALEKQIQASSLSANYRLEQLENDDQAINEIEFDLSIVDTIIDDKEENVSENRPNNALSPSKISIKKTRTFNDWLNVNEEDDEIEEERSVNREITYIEFDKPKRAFFSPVKIAKESLSEESLPVSETLAKIFEIQGNIPKAIYVYEQLGLIIPEKKSYFASLIRKLKKKLN
jgi:hypothetical protein